MRSMGDDSLIPISDEQAKLGQELVKAVSDAAGYFMSISGDIPQDLIGYLGSTDEVIVSFAHLNRLDCISIDEVGARSKHEPSMRPFGTLLMNVVSGSDAGRSRPHGSRDVCQGTIRSFHPKGRGDPSSPIRVSLRRASLARLTRFGLR